MLFKNHSWFGAFASCHQLWGKTHPGLVAYSSHNASRSCSVLWKCLILKTNSLAEWQDCHRLQALLLTRGNKRLNRITLASHDIIFSGNALTKQAWQLLFSENSVKGEQRAEWCCHIVHSVIWGGAVAHTILLAPESTGGKQQHFTATWMQES